MPNEIKFFGIIGDEWDELTASAVKKQIEAFDDTSEELVGRFDTPGGSVVAGLAIFSAIKAYPGPTRAVIESAAFSIGSYIAMAFDEIEITDNGYLMIHNPSMYTEGDDQQLARDAKFLEDLKGDMVKAYSARTGIPESEIEALMKAETYLSAVDALEKGFVSRVLEATAQSRIIGIEAYKRKLPFKVCASLRSDEPSGDPEPEPNVSDTQPVAATITEIEAAYPKAESAFVLSCIKRQLPMAEVAAEMNHTLTAENEALAGQVTELTEKVTELEAKLAEATTPEAKKTGNQPVGQSAETPEATAEDRWRQAVETEFKRTNDRAKAVQAANKKHPGLRQEMLKEANAA